MIDDSNRDPPVLPNPEKLQIAGVPNMHLSFGYTPHFCLGAQLERIEFAIAHHTSFDTLLNIALAITQINWKFLKVLGLRTLQFYWRT